MSSINLNSADVTVPLTREKNIASSAITRRLKGKTGKEYWRSLEELADTKEFREMIRKNFPSSASEFIDSMSRRRFLKLMGASLALAGVTGCSTKPSETLVPYVEKPEELILGRPLFYATAMTLGGATNGLLIEQREGRPIKVEGNPRHPNSLGSTDVFSQASLLTMYDPDRSETIRKLGRISTYDEFLTEFRGQLERLRARRGAGIRILTQSVVSPTLEAQLNTVRQLFPDARLHQYEPFSDDGALEGARLAFGNPVNTVYRFDRADVVLSLDADFLAGLPHNTRYIQDWSNRRRPEEGRPLNRFYMVESTHTNTGAKADHRLGMLARRIETFARVVASRTDTGVPAPGAESTGELDPAFVEGVIADLTAARGRSIVIAGRQQPAAVHALAHAMNQALGNVGQTVFHTAPIEAFPTNNNESLRQLVQDMNQARVEMLLILGGNPVYTAPADLNFAAALARVPFSAHLSLYMDETSQRTTWHIPETHFLESWSDARTFDGTVSLIQPLIEPLYGGSRTDHEVLTLFTDQLNTPAYDIVSNFWQQQQPGEGFERFFRSALHAGIIDGTDLPAIPVQVRPGLAERLPAQQPQSAEGLEVVFRLDPSLYDGRFANNGWLQELPKPISKLTWDNAVMINRETARELGLKTEDMVRVAYGGRTLDAPIFELAGQPRGTVTLHVGFGRQAAGRVGTETGFNFNALRTSEAPYVGTGLTLTKLNDRYRLATTQMHHLIEEWQERDIVRHATARQYAENPEIIHEMGHAVDASLYPEYDYNAYPGHYKWGMAIDMSTCVGCNACVVACEAENNIPVVGKDQVLMQREMLWLRIDSYFTGDPTNPDTYFQPMMCQHCEKAPCEVVCPVEATVHSIEGLNDMVYNRCVGTKYCSNNCPYKVRRFNWYQYNDKASPTLRMLRNPEVTVRERGVMEKCTYCTQRIAKARINAEREDRIVGGDEIKTACQAACPADAIIFGDLNQETSRVSQLHAQNRSYYLLDILNTQPRTAYMASITNPNPEVAPEAETEESHG